MGFVHRGYCCHMCYIDLCCWSYCYIRSFDWVAGSYIALYCSHKGSDSDLYIDCIVGGCSFGYIVADYIVLYTHIVGSDYIVGYIVDCIGVVDCNHNFADHIADFHKYQFAEYSGLMPTFAQKPQKVPSCLLFHRCFYQQLSSFAGLADL